MEWPPAQRLHFPIQSAFICVYLRFILSASLRLCVRSFSTAKLKCPPRAGTMTRERHLLMTGTREQICEWTSKKLAAAATGLSKTNAVVGLDGFVDEIIAVVDKRQDNVRFDAVKTIGHLGAKINAAIGQSSNYELVVKQMKLGGNGPIMANALASM